jgi:hypothetical protein
VVAKLTQSSSLEARETEGTWLCCRSAVQGFDLNILRDPMNKDVTGGRDRDLLGQPNVQ